jgi:hypothetical protein
MSEGVVAHERVVLAGVLHGRFYVRMAGVCLAVAVVGFAPTYWVPMLQGTLDIAPIAHLPAVFFYGWTLLFLRQTSLAASGRLTRHRELGVAGVALATGMVFAGLGMTINSLERMDAAGLGAAGRPFSIVSASAIALFAVLFTVAVVNVKRPEVHKRVMLVATVSLLQAAVGRWFVFFLAPPAPGGGVASPPPLPVTIVPGLLVNLLIVAAMLHDRRTRGRVHPAYWIAGGAVLAVQVLRVPLATTAAWARVTDWLLALTP